MKDEASTDFDEQALVNAVQDAIDYRFGNPQLLVTAFTHPSFTFLHPEFECNQRLEFLGDAVLGIILADYAYKNYTDAREGILTNLRSAIVSGASLGKKAQALGFGSLLRLDKGARKSGGGENPHNLADVMESTFGAVYLDGGIDEASRIFHRLFADDLDALKSKPIQWNNNPKGELQTYAQRSFHTDPVYTELGREGSDSAPIFHISVSVGKFREKGSGASKREASAKAAEKLLAKLQATSASR